MRGSDRKPGHTLQTLGGTQIQIEVGPISDAANHARNTRACHQLISEVSRYQPFHARTCSTS
jgi:hypothetical protein